jgi:hypothetical protein
MFPTLQAKLIGILVSLIATFFLLASVYYSGYTSGKASNQKEIDALSTKSNAVKEVTENAAVRIVKQYVYRDRIITEKATELDRKVENVLKEESKDCRIGPGFIGLHNNATSTD